MTGHSTPPEIRSYAPGDGGDSDLAVPEQGADVVTFPADDAPPVPGDAGPVVFLMGPTAAGKTAIAAALAERGPFQIVSVDSALVFRHLDIGTGKPNRALLARAPHRLIDIRNPDERYSAAEFRSDAMRAISDIRASGGVPLLAGGTGLYFRALEMGLAVLPPANPPVRIEIERQGPTDSGGRRCMPGWPASIRRRRDASTPTILSASSVRSKCMCSPDGRCRSCLPAAAAADSRGRCAES